MKDKRNTQSNCEERLIETRKKGHLEEVKETHLTLITTLFSGQKLGQLQLPEVLI